MGDDNRDEYLSKQIDKLEKTVDKVDEKCDNIDKSVASMSSRFEDHMRQDEKMYEEFKRMVDILQENTNDLKHHISRTDALQDLVVKFEARITPIEQERLKKAAVKEFFVEKSIKWGKILAVIGSVASLIYYILKIKAGV